MTSQNSFPLSESVSHLLHHTGVMIASRFEVALRAEGLTVPKWRILATLGQYTDLRLNDLADHSRVEISTLSRQVMQLEKRKLLVRAPSKLDSRAISLSLTGAGRALMARLVPVARHYEALFVAGFTEAEVRQLKRLLLRVDRNAAAIRHESDGAIPVEST